MDFMQEEFSIGSTHFRIGKFPALQGWRVLESIRAEMGRAFGKDMDPIPDSALIDPNTLKVDKTKPEAVKAGANSFVKLILGLSEPFVDKLRLRLYTVIYFKNSVVKDYVPMSEAEDTALMDLSPFDVYVVMGRALAVNFFGSLLSLFGSISSEPQSSKQ